MSLQLAGVDTNQLVQYTLFWKPDGFTEYFSFVGAATPTEAVRSATAAVKNVDFIVALLKR